MRSSYEILDFICINAINAKCSIRLGRYIDDVPRKYANSIIKMVLVRGNPWLVLKAMKDVHSNMKLRFGIDEVFVGVKSFQF